MKKKITKEYMNRVEEINSIKSKFKFYDIMAEIFGIIFVLLHALSHLPFTRNIGYRIFLSTFHMPFWLLYWVMTDIFNFTFLTICCIFVVKHDKGKKRIEKLEKLNSEEDEDDFEIRKNLP